MLTYQQLNLSLTLPVSLSLVFSGLSSFESGYSTQLIPIFAHKGFNVLCNDQQLTGLFRRWDYFDANSHFGKRKIILMKT